MNDQTRKQGLTLRDELAIERNELAVERNDLAIQRNELANERTVLAYARTSIMSFLTGVTLLKLYTNHGPITALAWISIAISVLIVLIGLWKFIHRFRLLSRAHERRRPRADRV